MSKKEEFRVLLTGEFSTIASSWTEHLCMQRRNPEIILSSRSYEVLSDLSELALEQGDGAVDYDLPETIKGKTVVGVEDGEYVIGGELVPQDDDAELTLEPGDVKKAREWLELRDWHTKPGFSEAWEEIRQALADG
jgi:hypothetical protein